MFNVIYNFKLLKEKHYIIILSEQTRGHTSRSNPPQSRH